MVYIPDALCAKMKQPDVLNVFFPKEHAVNNNEARELCSHCPVLDECREKTLLFELEGSLRRETAIHGTAGCLTQKQRRSIVSLLAKSERAGQRDRGVVPKRASPVDSPRGLTDAEDQAA